MSDSGKSIQGKGKIDHLRRSKDFLAGAKARMAEFRIADTKARSQMNKIIWNLRKVPVGPVVLPQTYKGLMFLEPDERDPKIPDAALSEWMRLLVEDRNHQ